MHFAKTFLAAVVLSLAVRHAAAAGTIFVKANATGANNGTSWTDAYPDLQLALAAAVSNDESWVAAGTYKPTSTADRTISFALKNGVGIYGGFAGTETMLSQRNPMANVTILSGDIGAAIAVSDNSYHVVTAGGTVTPTGVLDGFTIRDGRADGPGDPTDRGGGVYNQGSPSFVRCVFSNNYAANRGGGVRVASGSPSFTSCTFRWNFASSAGAGLSAASVGNMQVRGCVFSGNNVGNSTGGGAIEATDNTTVANSLIVHNAPNGMNFLGSGNTFVNLTVWDNQGYGVALFATDNSISNSIFWGNSITSLFLGPSASVSISYSDIQGGFVGTGNINANPLFLTPFTDPDLRLGPGSPAIDAGNNASVPVGVTTDVAGLPRFFDDPGAPNVGAGTPPLVDMGAHERIPLSVSVPSPSNQTVCEGAPASFTVTASGSPPLAYRWRRYGVNLVDDGRISGSGTATVTISSVVPGDFGQYDVVVTDGYGQPRASTAATLGITPIPATPVASNNGPICAGETLQLSASFVLGASYSWTGPNSFTAFQQNPSIDAASTAASGTYSVTATAGDECHSAPATTNAVVNPSPSAVVTAPPSVCPNATGTAASVPDAGIGASYTWSITNGTITGGAGTRNITFTAGSFGTVMLGVTVQNGGCSSMSSTNVSILTTCPTSFFTVTPCRVVDTRDPDGPWGGPALAAGAERLFTIVERCTVPSSARAVSLNVIVTQPTALGYLSLYPGGTAQPLASTLNYQAGQTRANNAIVPLGADGSLAATCGQSSGTTHLIIDVTGYFE